MKMFLSAMHRKSCVFQSVLENGYHFHSIIISVFWTETDGAHAGTQSKWTYMLKSLDS